jgi:hypothetical protein
MEVGGEGESEEDEAEPDKLGAKGWTRKMSIPDARGGRHGELGTELAILGTLMVVDSGKAFKRKFRIAGEVVGRRGGGATVQWPPYRWW